jgi:hypothetical protein
MRNVFIRTGTSNWLNNATLNGRPGGAGPGIIRPHVRIGFQKLGPIVDTQESGNTITSASYPNAWGSFDLLITNAPTVYPCETAPATIDTIVRLGIDDWNRNRLATYLWSLPLTNGQSVALQSSTNLVDWSTCIIVTNLATVVEWHHSGTSQNQRFFRAVPQ